MNKNILVTGAHRSGTTWVGRTISQHPDINYINEPFNVEWPNKIINYRAKIWFEHYYSSSEKEKIRNAFDDLFKVNLIKHAKAFCQKKDFAIAKPYYFTKYIMSRLFDKKRILIKDALALFSADWLYKRYTLNVIVMIRNPLGFVGSLKKAGWDFDFANLNKQTLLMKNLLRPFTFDIKKICKKKPNDFIDRACLLWNILHYVIYVYKKKYPQWIFLKHEDIAQNPILEFERLFMHLGLKMDDSIKSYILNYTSPKNPKESVSTNYMPRNSKSSLFTWKQRLNAIEIERIKVTTRKVAHLFHYC